MHDLYQAFVVLLQLFAIAIAATVLGMLLFVVALSGQPLRALAARVRRRRRAAVPLARIA